MCLSSPPVLFYYYYFKQDIYNKNKSAELPNYLVNVLSAFIGAYQFVLNFELLLLMKQNILTFSGFIY